MLSQPRWFSLSLALLLLPLMASSVTGDAASDLADLQEKFHKMPKSIWPFTSSTDGKEKIEEGFRLQQANVSSLLNSLNSIDRGQLSRHQQYSYDVLKDVLTTKHTNFGFRHYGPLNPVSFMAGFFHHLAYVVSKGGFQNKKQYNDFIKLMDGWVVETKQMMMLMDEAIRYGTTQHLVSVNKVQAQIGGITSVLPRNSLLYEPFKAKLDGLSNISARDRRSLKNRGLRAVRNVWAALKRLKNYMKNTYNPNTRKTFGVYGLPFGENYYRACLKWHASMDMTPGQVFKIGQDEVNRITQLMTQIIRRNNFQGTIREYFNKMENDNRFKLDTSAEIISGFENIINRAYPKLPPLFKDIPPGRPVVKPRTSDGVYALYYRGSEDGTVPGVFLINTIRPSDTKTYNMPALALHETVPGHHLQALYERTSSVPAFQKSLGGNYFAIPYEFPFYTAFMEGWGLYSEYLGEEMDMYRDDNEMMGRLGFEMFRACRLVVDVGIHYKKWSRTKAIRYMHQRVSLSLTEVRKEVDRYITWPGQALAYKLGELEIKKLRDMAKAELGRNFDVRDFHSLVLTNGRLPISVLKKIIRDYVQDARTARNADSAFAGGLAEE